MANKSVTIVEPPSIDATRCIVTRTGGVTKMHFIYEPTASPQNVQFGDVLDSALTAGQRTDLNASLLAAYTIWKTAQGF